MGTVFAVAVLVGMAYAGFLFLSCMWGLFEIDAVDYEQLSIILQRYPDLVKYISTFPTTNVITRGEYRKVLAEAHRRAKNQQTEEMLQQRRILIMKYFVEDRDKKQNANIGFLGNPKSGSKQEPKAQIGFLGKPKEISMLSKFTSTKHRIGFHK